MIKHIFKHPETGLYYNGNEFAAKKDNALKYPPTVTAIYFGYSYRNLEVIQEEVTI